jgi:hypothetical protein
MILLTPLIVASDQECRLAELNAAPMTDITQAPWMGHKSASLEAPLSVMLEANDLI